jgi:hypothetical protein
MFGRRADRPQGEPEQNSIETEVERLTPVLREGTANVYTMPTGPGTTPRYVGSYSTEFDSGMLGEWQQRGYLVYS